MRVILEAFGGKMVSTETFLFPDECHQFIYIHLDLPAPDPVLREGERKVDYAPLLKKGTFERTGKHIEDREGKIELFKLVDIS